MKMTVKARSGSRISGGSFKKLQPLEILWFSLAALRLGGRLFVSRQGAEPLRKPRSVTELMRQTYDVLRQLEPVILENRGTGKMAGSLAETVEQRQPQKVFLNGYALNPTDERPPGTIANNQTTPPASGALVIALGADEFLFAGTGTVITFEAESSGAPVAGILSADEGRFENGAWKPGRRLNGDRTHQGRHIRLETNRISIRRVKLYRYQ